jgi:dihydroorotate dehydrogenase electron transfer subunit
VGAQSADLLPLALVEGARAGAGGEPARLLEAFAPYGTGDVIATDDGSVGRKGFVTEALADWLAEVPFPPDQLAVYCCGPEAMMKATAELCRKAGIACQVSMERSMACGMGTCQSCICKTRADNDQGFRYSLCCTDGPVFEAQEILW